MTKDSDAADLGGCVLALWSLCVVTPMWLVLFFMVLNALGESVPTWGWVLYWVYVPSMIFGVICASVVKAMK